jgi:hypothetical protein
MTEQQEELKFLLTMIGIFTIIFGSMLFLYHNAKTNCEKSGGSLAREMVGKSYRLECVK